MRISRNEAVNLIEEKISKFRKIFQEAECNNCYNEEYRSLYDETTVLLSDLFSEAEVKNFQGAELPYYETKLQEYKRKLIQCVIKLEDYKERIQNFWFNGTIGGDTRLIEKALLLMRFYEKEEIYEISRKMGVPFYDQFTKYDEMSYYRGALETAKAIRDDRELIQLLEENRPQYGLSLGGFRASYYTATERGELSLEGSWGKIRESVKRTLECWDKIAYGVLQAIVDKGGTATDVDIRLEIERELGPGYSWEVLLERLQKQKLVFEVSCAGNPCWRMPEEIIPVVHEELLLYKRLVNIFPDIIETRRQINLIFKQKFKTILFKDDEVAMNDIQKPCDNEEDFNNRIQALSTLLDKMETGALKKHVNLDLVGSVSILEGFLNKKFPGYSIKIISNFRNIIILRSKKHPIHPDDPGFIRALGYFGFRYPPDDWERLWKVVLDKYLESLELLFKCLNE